MRAIQFYIVRLALHLLYLIPIIPIAMFGQYLEREQALSQLAGLIALIGLIYLVGAIYLAHRTAHHMVFEDQVFSAALRSAVYDLRLCLAFLPLVGHWFIPEEDKRNYDKDDDDA